MTRSKLSDIDKQELIRLFKETSQTITSLAEQFQVSISTARRLLKTQLSTAEYEALLSSRVEDRAIKRTGPLQQPNAEISAPAKTALAIPMLDSANPVSLVPNAHPHPLDQEPEEFDLDAANSRRSRRRSSAHLESEDSFPGTMASGKPLPVLKKQAPILRNSSSITVDPISDANPERDPFAMEGMPLRETMDPLVAPVSEDELLGLRPWVDLPTMEIQPLDGATLPLQCYLVVDRASELITRPLKDFAELGQIPSDEEWAKTLPVFDNHKVASRFSDRTQRVIKLPNGNLLKRTQPQLTAKGITRLLCNGQVYAVLAEDKLS
jgi:transposase-like protein